MSQITPNTKLYNLLVSKNFDLKATDTKTGRSPVDAEGNPDISEADQFSFDYVADSGRNYGTVVILLGSDKEFTVFFGDNVGKSMEAEDKTDWFDFLYQLKQFSTKNFFKEFSPENINKLRYSKQGQASINEGLFESWQGKGNLSWNAEPTEARLMIKHKKALGEGEARFRYIESLFIETAEGERYKLKSRNLTAGKAMLEHVRQGGNPYDARANHINTIVEELALLSRFRRANAGQIFEGETQQLISETDAYYTNMHSVLKHLGSSRGYNAYFESWNPAEVTEADIVIEDLKNLFVKQTIDHRIEEALPILARIAQQGDAMKETQIFESWINNLVEGTWAIPETPEQQQILIDLLSKELPVGADATNATEQLYDIFGDDVLFDQLQELASVDNNADADARPIIIARLQELAPQSAEIQQVLDAIGDINQAETNDIESDEQISQEVKEEATCNETHEGEYCPEHGLEECGSMYEMGTVAGGMAPVMVGESYDALASLKRLALGK